LLQHDLERLDPLHFQIKMDDCMFFSTRQKRRNELWINSITEQIYWS
jgi:hypothetical protein